MSETIFSRDRVYRYTLWREWDSIFTDFAEKHKYVNFICLNPSTADEHRDDPTMRKCMKFARAWGFDAMCVTNIFAYRSTDPEGMKRHPAPVGPDNDAHIASVARDADMVIASWSQYAGHLNRSREVREILKGVGNPVYYLRMGTGKAPEPYHPLYLPDSTTPTPWVTM